MNIENANHIFELALNADIPHDLLVANPAKIGRFKGVFTRLSNAGFDEILIRYSPDYTREDLNHLNFGEALNAIENNIHADIREYLRENGNDIGVLYNIALAIHFWGGNSGFRKTLSGHGFLLPANFNAETYNDLVQLIVDETPLDALVKSWENALHGCGVSFGTKHLCFWSSMTDRYLPIYDRVLALGLFEVEPNWRDYKDYYAWINQKSIEHELSILQIERMLFNYLNNN